VGKEMVYDAIIKVAKENTFDSAISYITSLQWDKVYRLDTWLSKVYGTPEDKYHIAVGSNWIKGMVKRLVDPGCKFDFVLVLEGEQGVKKSTSLYVLGGEWHTETAMSTDSKDFFMQFSGKSIIEFSEGETLSRTEVKRMKAIITMQYDRFRLPYERSTMDFPRRCVFAMTTNQSEYLKDETGNRRWLPVRVLLPEANIEWLKENREQLLAEAYHRITVKKETIYEFPLEETRNEQQARRMQDPYTDSVVNWYYNVLKKSDRENGITIFQVYQQVYRGGSTFGSQMAKWEEMSIANLLKDSMKLEKRKVMRDGVRSVRWYNPNEEVEMTNEQMVESILVKGNF
jgi:predicted P-loop ATPase